MSILRRAIGLILTSVAAAVILRHFVFVQIDGFVLAVAGACLVFGIVIVSEEK